MTKLIPAALAVLLCLTAPLRAQEVAGTLLDPAGQPVRAAVVALLDEAGVRHAVGLTDARGEFRLRAASAGRYRVRADRVGFERTVSPALQLTAGEAVPLRLTASVAVVTLEGITVRRERRCRASRTGEEALIWEEARKALAATQQAEIAGTGRYEVLLYRRELDPVSLGVRRDQRTRQPSTSARAFRSVSADSLLGQGFVEAVGDSVAWHAPDATLLLSDQFLATHCFSAVPHPDSASLVGLRFRPVRGRRLPDVAGTLWLQRSSAALRYLEFGYVNAGLAAADRRVGGRVEFEQLASGIWLVRRWWIRMPLAGPEELHRPALESRLMVRLRGLAEVGGEVQAAGERELATASGPGRIEGMVWDSLRGRPLADARVHLSRLVRSATTGSAGTFVLDSIPLGTFTVSFTHPQVDAGGVSGRPLQVVVRAGAPARVVLASPSGRRVMESHCGYQPARRGVLLGQTTAPRGARVQVSWVTAERGAREERETVVGPEGRFTLCGVEAETTLEVSIVHPGGAHRETLALDEGPVHFYRVQLP